MRNRPPRFRFSISLKLLLWSTLLLAVFYVISTLLINRVHDIELLSSGIVGVNYRVIENSEQMAQQLISLIENQKRFEILEKEEYRQLYLRNLLDYAARLRELRRLNPDIPEPWVGLALSLAGNVPWDPEDENLRPGDILRATADEANPSPSQDWVFLPEETVNEWLGILTEARSENRARMQERLVELNSMAVAAEKLGHYGVIATLLLGVVGSLAIALSLGRALRELRRGIRSLTHEGELKQIRVLTSDELGELSEAFNNMTEQLKREERMRSDFISMLSHEIRTPLTSVRESTNLLKQGLLGEVNERQARFLDISGKEINRLSSLLSRLMNVSSMESRDLVLNLEPVDVRELTWGTSERMQPTAEAKQIAIGVEAPESGHEVWADAEHIRQVLLNFLGNAIKFAPAHTEVTLIARIESDRERVVFCVRDRGPGIPEDEQPFVFRKYYRATEVRDSVDGAGLGLSISKRIVEAHGGSVWVSSTPGEGSEFCFALPLAPGSA